MSESVPAATAGRDGPAAHPGGVDSRPRWRRVRLPVLLAGGVLAVSVLLHLRDPHQQGSWGACPWLILTGTYCPGCGGLRAVNDLTRGDLPGAASSNLLLVGALPVVVALWARWLVDRSRGVVRYVDDRRGLAWGGAVIVALLGFAVLRNLPAGTWLAP